MSKGVKFIFGIVALVFVLFCFNVLLNTADKVEIKHGHFEAVSKGVGEIVDSEGNVWEWKLEEGEKVVLGKEVTLVMDNKGTRDKKDDEIVEIKG